MLMMKNVVTGFLFFVSISMFSQNTEIQLNEAFSKKSDLLLIEFFNAWQKEIQPNDFDKLSENLKTVSNLMCDIYLKEEENHSPFAPNKYVLIDTRKVVIKIAKEDLATKKILNLINKSENFTDDNENSLKNSLIDFKWKISKSDTLYNFNPVYKNYKTLYLDAHYKTILHDFLMENSQIEDPEKAIFLKNKINYFTLHSRHLSTFSKISEVTLFISMKFAIVYWDEGYCAGNRFYCLNKNNKWEHLFDLITVCE
jgi:hypothetical protein